MNPLHSSSGNRSIAFLGGLLAISFALTILFGFVFSELKYEYEERGGSLLWRLIPEQEREERITIVAIDEKSLAEVGAWPWPRQTMADLSNKLADYGASLQLFDIVFPEAKLGDALFHNALVKNNGVLSQVPIFDGQSALRGGQLNGALERTRCQYPTPKVTSFLANTPTLAISQVGHITPIVDRDGMIRKQPPLVCIDGQVYPSLALQGILSSINSTSPSVSIHNNDAGLFSSDWKVSIDSYFGLSIPIDKQGNMRLSYRQSPESFQVVSAADVLNGTAPASLIENTWILIGATAFGLGDVVPTPHSGMTPGVELQARLLSSLLDGRTPYSPAFTSYLLVLFGVCASVVLILLTYTKNKVSAYALPIATASLPIFALLLHAYFLSYDIWLGWFNGALYSLIAGILFVLADHQVVRHQHLRVFSHLSSYLPKSVAQGLLNRSPSGAIEASRHDLVLMCADLRNFSAFEESRPPEEAAALLHCFFVNATEIIESFEGQVEEYKGDSLLASWSSTQSNSATSNALEAADALQKMISSILPQHPPKGLEPLALGVSIERGPTLVGSIGPMHRRHHTLLGDTVTIVLRMQEMTQDLAQPILVGECAARDLRGDALESQGSFLLDGLTTPHVLFAPKTHHIDPLIGLDNKVLKMVHRH